MNLNVTKADLERNNIRLVYGKKQSTDELENTFDFDVYQGDQLLKPYLKILNGDFVKVCVRPKIDGVYHQLMYVRLVNTLLGYDIKSTGYN